MDRVSAISFPPSLPERRQRGRQGRDPRSGDRDIDDTDAQRPEHAPERRRCASEDILVGGNERLRIEVEPASGRLVYLAVDVSTGQVLREYAPDEALGLIRRVREVAGLAVDTSL